MPKASPDTHIVQIRMPLVLWEKFSYSCKANLTNPSECIRQFARTYVAREMEVRASLEEDLEKVEERRTMLKADASDLAREQHKKEHESSKEMFGGHQ